MQFLFGLIFLSYFSIGAELTTIKNDLKKSIDKAPGKTSEYSIWVGQDDGTPVFTVNEATARIPASLTKIFTAGAVLKKIPVHRRFLTEVWAGKNPEESAICLKGGGDPTFVSETMWVLVNNFSRLGVKSIKQGIIVDDTLFDKQYIDPSRESVRVDRAYDAPVSAMSFNWNSINVIVRPGPTVGSPAIVYLDPETKYLRLKANVKTIGKGRERLSVERKSLKPFGDLIEITGEYPLGESEKIIYKNISDPALWSGYAFIEFLSQRGIKVAGDVKVAPCPMDFEMVARSESWPLSMVVADMMKFSNNYVAEMLTKHLSNPTPSNPGSLEGGLVKIREIIEESGIEKSDYALINPSGLTRKNQFNAKDMGKFLQFIQRDFQIFPEFLASLPISGQDGTLKSRMPNPPAKGWIRAKTGMLNGAIGLAGFAGRQSGEVITFVFIYNGTTDTYKVRDFFDQIAEVLVR